LASYDWTPIADRFTTLAATDPVFAQNPDQVVVFTEEVQDFGQLDQAQLWMDRARTAYATNLQPNALDGVTIDFTAPALGSDVIAYQEDWGADTPTSTPYTGPLTGEVETVIQVRRGTVVFAIALQSGPGASVRETATKLMQQLIDQGATACGSAPSTSPTAASGS
jgi:hypothetical protein